jgi:sec-independent protein translocase protein TatC
MPLAIKFFLSFETLSTQTSMPIQLEAKVSEYLSLIMVFMFAFGLSFELPVLLVLLATVGLIDSKYLSERRRYIIVIIFIIAAIITPPDPISQIGLAIPLMILYEISILVIKYLERSKNDKS